MRLAESKLSSHFYKYVIFFCLPLYKMLLLLLQIKATLGPNQVIFDNFHPE